MNKQETQNSLRQKLKKIARKEVSFSEVAAIATETLGTGGTLPLLIKPVTDNIDLVDWAEDNRQSIETKLSEHGAIIFQGFRVSTAPEFENFGQVICSELFNENGEHPRQTVSGNVYTPVFYPGDRKLLWHNENSFNLRFPRKILFCCRQPALQGGETPIVDSRKVFELIDPKIRERFIEKKVMYVRNYIDGLGLNWETVFQTKTKAEVEARCQRDRINFEWKSEGQLRTRAVRPAVVKHPQTGEMSWFTQAQHWHPACLEPETRESLLSLFSESDLPRNCYYGDGTLIEDSVMAEICEIYQQLEFSFPWQQGDVLLLDNLLMAHGRNPFIGDRKLLVAMGEMMSFLDIE